MSGPSVRLHAPPTSARVSSSSLRALEQALRDRPAAGNDPAAGAPRPSESGASPFDQAQVQELLGHLEQRLAEVEALHTQLTEEGTTLAIQLAVGIAKELVRTEIAAGNYDIEAVVRKALAVASTGRAPCTIHLHPDDLGACDPARFRSNTRFEADPEIARGDVHISTPQGLLVHDIDAALIRVREELLEASR